ncbi:hypothetical protein [Paenibacillus sp. Y412MC10]|uniref:hypothetical protein n=1 Tax=Geobacillus sp. (strain Y412MC10) TaxID=481743 RepID=UPI0011A278DB|nr:hypothetical protein [Paenibacillus sp. Y412MC10]
MFNDRNIRTAQKSLRHLYFNHREYTDVFLINGSPQERRRDVEEIIQVGYDPRIVLCSLQYTDEVKDSFKYFTQKGYFIYLHWLNPGYKDQSSYGDSLNLIPILLTYNSLVGQRSGKIDPTTRTEEIKEYIYNWAKKNQLIKLLNSTK